MTEPGPQPCRPLVVALVLLLGTAFAAEALADAPPPTSPPSEAPEPPRRPSFAPT